MANGGSDKSSLGGFVARLTAMTADDDAHDTYEQWAPTYETDLIEGYGYTAHSTAADALAAASPDRSAAVLDMGCGTGLVGEALAARGYTCIDGADASGQMLGEAATKGVYRTLLSADLTAPGALPDAAYDAAIAVGVFGGGHIGPEHLACFAGPVRPGGTIVLFANGIPFVEDSYRSHLEALEKAGLWSLDAIRCVNYMQRVERPGWLVVARRSPV